MGGETHRWAAVLAGGAGTRFWPASRKARPKPFLDVLGTGPLIRLTAERMLPLVHAEGLFFVLGEHLVPLLDEAIPAPHSRRAIGEPVARNTLGAVLLAMGWTLAHDPDGRLAVLPADHVIPDVEAFRGALAQAYELADRYVVTLGVVPTHPETGYGYIRQGEALPADTAGGAGAYAVERFVEKPDRETARRFLAGGYLWNSGIFVVPVTRFLATVEAVEPYYGEVVREAARLFGEGAAEPEALRALLEPLPNLNIDKAVVEHCEELAVIPVTFAWSDVGTWDAAWEHRQNGTENLEVGDVMVLEGRRNVVVSTQEGPTVTLSQVDDLVVVATGDAVLVTRRGAGQQVGDVVRRLRRLGREELL